MHRTLAVTTDDAQGKFTDLTVTVDIPESVTITPRFLFWRVGDAPEEKAAEITIADPKAVTVDGWSVPTSDFRRSSCRGKPEDFAWW